MADYAYVVFGKRFSSDIIQPISCDLHSQWSSVEFFYILVGQFFRTSKKNNCLCD